MKRLLIALAGVVAFASAANAAETWIGLGSQVQPQNAAKFLAAADKLFTKQTPPGRIMFMANNANGANPTTHTVVAIYKSAAARAAYVEKLSASPDWATFQSTIADLGTPTGEVIYSIVKSWGDAKDSDVVWSTFLFDVNDPAAFVAATEKWMASPTGKKFPGQLHLSAVVAGGMTPVSHVFTAGYETVAEREAFSDMLPGNEDWTAYVTALNEAATFLGAAQAAMLQDWGNTPMSEFAVK